MIFATVRSYLRLTFISKTLLQDLKILKITLPYGQCMHASVCFKLRLLQCVYYCIHTHTRGKTWLQLCWWNFTENAHKQSFKKNKKKGGTRDKRDGQGGEETLDWKRDMEEHRRDNRSLLISLMGCWLESRSTKTGNSSSYHQHQ